MPTFVTRRQSLVAATALVCNARAAEPARVLHVVNALLPPYVFEPGDAAGEGLDIDTTREALQRGGGGFEIRVSVVPWRRALALLEHGQAELTPSVRITPERQRFLAFSRPYGDTVRHAVYTRADSGLTLVKPADLTGLRVGLAAGFALPPRLQAALTGRIERATDTTAVLGMLLAQRVQAVVLNELPAQWLVRQRGWLGQLVAQPLRFDSGDQTQMGFSRRSPWLKEGLATIDRGLALMAKDKTFECLASRYRQP